ncbi:hypothetical protein [Saccharibacillus sacchari]|uniref:Uncharacterized protein n=1 Tax=Saccharibacillus sacchari TaxID=456493 RepID=A0ACC6PI96_9BACL
MLRATENETEKKLRGLKKENPNYDAMWSRVRLEADKRASGWQEQAAAPIRKPSAKKRWLMPVTCAALAAVIALGAAASQGYFETLIPDAKAAPLGQSIGAQAEVEGMTLKLNNVVQGTDRAYGQTEAQKKMMLDFSLSGFGDEDVRMAAFDQASITDLDTGKKLDLMMGDFNTDYSHSIEDWASSRTLNTSSRVNGDISDTEGQHRYRLETSGLYMIRRVTVPIEGNVKVGAEYTVLPERDFKIKITDIQWDQKQGQMKIKFLPNENVPVLDTKDSATLGMDRNNSVTLKLGDRDLGPGGWMQPLEPEPGVSEAEGEYDVKGLTEDQIADMTMTFSYAEPVRVVEGPWTIDFTIDSSKAIVQTETVPVEDASELTEKAGWTLGDAQLDAYGVTIPMYRNNSGSEKTTELKDGQVVQYSVSITDGEVTTSGSQDPIPGIPTGEEREGQQEYIKFGVQGMARNNPTDHAAYESWDSYDFRGKPLTAIFNNAWVAHRHDDYRKEIPVPTENEQTTADTIPEGLPIKYIVHREGKNVLVQVEAPEGMNMYEGISLEVDGESYAHDTDESKATYVQNIENRQYERVYVFENVPQGQKFELGLQAYGTVDNTKNAKVIIRK